MSTEKWDQKDLETQIGFLRRQSKALSGTLKLRGHPVPDVPAFGANDLVDEHEKLESHVAKLHALNRILPDLTPPQAKAAPTAASASHSSAVAAPPLLRKPQTDRKLTATEKALAAKRAASAK